jgi:hypothetical protein
MYNSVEHEVILLDIAVRTLNNAVNNSLLHFMGSKESGEIMFNDDAGQKYFYLMVLDYISGNADSALLGSGNSCEQLMGSLTRKPAFNVGESINSLLLAVSCFNSWLNTHVTREIWLPSLNKTVVFVLKRQDIVYVTANIAKHHFGHLTNVLARLDKASHGQFGHHGLITSLDEIYYDLFDNILSYHASKVSQLLNDIRWGIHNYLLPEYNRAYTKTYDGMYTYAIPQELNAELAVSCYWELMNGVRGKPYMKQFTTNKYLSLRY